ncbi:alpha/beta hydrolase [Streptomyces celluloflavus]|uniref:alpha/beta hydrolase n=1 Tax=Streptomyces celluloflavus TaxID=58344 RepID=UPI0036D7FB26
MRRRLLPGGRGGRRRATCLRAPGRGRAPALGRALTALLLTTALGTAGRPALAALPAPLKGTGLLHWTACARPDSLPEARCTTLRVPLDHSRPGGPTIPLVIARLPARHPERRIGPLLINGGGPGGSAVRDVATAAPPFDTPELDRLRDRFDLIGMDPRGVGESAPVRCDRPLRDPAVRAFPRTPAEFARLAHLNRDAGRSCRRATGPLLAHVDTRSVVRDVDAVRVALGAETLSWFGLSYGTEIGTLYAEHAPHRVRAMVLDGAVDHDRSTRRAALDEARATEAAFARFTAWCRTGTTCALHGWDVPAVYDRLMADAERGRVRAAAPGVGRRLAASAEELAGGAYTYLTERARWPRLAQALAAAAGTDGPPDASALLRAAPYGQSAYPSYRAVGCHDFAPGTRGFADFKRRWTRLRAAAPHTWRYSEFWDWTSGCLGWPVKAANPPAPVDVRGTPPVLVVSTLHDPATPYAWARALASDIAGARLLTADLDGHTGALHSSCARAQEAAYLVTVRLPAAGSVCRR